MSNTLRKTCFSGIHIALIMASRSQRAMAFNAGTVSLRKPKQRVDDRTRFYARAMETFNRYNPCDVAEFKSFQFLLFETAGAGSLPGAES